MKIIITGKIAFWFMLVFVVLIGSFLISAEGPVKQRLANFVDSNLDSVDADSNGRIDFSDTSSDLSFYYIQGLGSCYTGVLRGFDESNNNLQSCSTYANLWNQIKYKCEVITRSFGTNSNGDISCPSDKVMLYATASGRTGTIVCC
ncbi:hypothetical protein HN592_05175 [Candidatus Woesearchaeota archaeon]|jgi:hypothetical protein|nr:hypothetical protein [Candidatus Woesearchaeota archaeon]MBT4367777.1 hypothetical protein [Candidatus Woesearchaeota archaeon]MBT4712265.1 hypothetical protein [Candidatus Woesearchaeota archaeon]MBT6638813.1 hypothetical protein [Candidatus Woesearchaeota archaeon]MBT7134457.1 hypothetical protein [Candidatus Woesearchaeota archaeon]